MRDKKDNATLDLPGFNAAVEPLVRIEAQPTPPVKRHAVARPRKSTLKQEQLELLDATDASGLPMWNQDANLDLTGLPNWAAA